MLFRSYDQELKDESLEAEKEIIRQETRAIVDKCFAELFFHF